MREHKFDSYFGRKIAVDASMHIYSFLVRFLAWCALGFPVVSSPTLPVRTGDVSSPYTYPLRSNCFDQASLVTHEVAEGGLDLLGAAQRQPW